MSHEVFVSDSKKLFNLILNMKDLQVFNTPPRSIYKVRDFRWLVRYSREHRAESERIWDLPESCRSGACQLRTGELTACMQETGLRAQQHRGGGGKDRPKESHAPAPPTHLLNPGAETLPVTYRLRLLTRQLQACNNVAGRYALAPPSA